MTRMQDEASYRAKLWQRIQLASERLRLIEGIRRLPEPEREHFAPWIDFLEDSPEEYPRLKRDMERIGFDLRKLMAPAQAKEVGVRLAGAWRLLVPLSPRAANDNDLSTEYRKAANFSTSEQKRTQIVRQGSGVIGEDTFEIVARPDPMEKRVQISLWIEKPKSVKPGRNLFVTLPGPDGPRASIPVELRTVEDRLQGDASVSMPWPEFVALVDEGVVVSDQAIPEA